MCRNILSDLPAQDHSPHPHRVRIKKLLLFVKNLRRGKAQDKMRPVPWWKMLALHSGMERLRLEAGMGAGSGAGSGRQQSSQQPQINLPPSISLPDGEEFPYGSSTRMHIRDPEQESEIYQKCIRPPPNRTVFDGESPPPYRARGSRCQGLPAVIVPPRKSPHAPAPGAAPFPAGPGKHSTNPVQSVGAGLIRLLSPSPSPPASCRTAQAQADDAPAPTQCVSSSPGDIPRQRHALAALTMVPCLTESRTASARPSARHGPLAPSPPSPSLSPSPSPPPPPPPV